MSKHDAHVIVSVESSGLRITCVSYLFSYGFINPNANRRLCSFVLLKLGLLYCCLL